MDRADALQNALALLMQMDLAGHKGRETLGFATMLKTLHEMYTELREEKPDAAVAELTVPPGNPSLKGCL